MLRPSDSPAEPDGQPAEAERYLELVRALTPQMIEAAEAIDRDRRIPEPLFSGLIDAEFFRMVLPRSIGGGQVHPLTLIQVVGAIAEREASTAWNICQNSICGMTAAYMQPKAARKVFGDKRAILAWGPPDSSAKAVAEPGGYRVNGNWSFASGMRHATWLGAYCPVFEADGTPRLDDRGQPVRRVMLVPAEETTITDIWDVIGLRGTASDAFSVTDHFVPEEFSVMRDNFSERRDSGWLYYFAHTNLYACGFASIALGVARSLLDSFVELAMEKTPRGYANPMRENAATQTDIAEAEARLRSARVYLENTLGTICDEVQHSDGLTLEHRMAIRLAATHCIQEAQRVGNFAYEAAGASAIFRANPFERRFRDLHSIAQQVQGRRSHYETVGKFLLGVESPSIFL